MAAPEATRRRRGRPPLAWLTPEQTLQLPAGTAIVLERDGRHDRRLVGRVSVWEGRGTPERPHPFGGLILRTTTDEALIEISPFRIKRARVVEGLFEPGDPVLRRRVPASVWRGGVVRVDGTDVLVEQIGGGFAWFAEDDLEPAEARQDESPLLSPLAALPT